MRMSKIEERLLYRASLIPQDAARDPRSSDLGEAFLYENGGGFCAVAFRKTSGTPEFRYRWVRPENREAHLANWFASLESSAAIQAARFTERKAKLAGPNPLAVGDILRCSWGYDQTNVEYYEVVDLVGKRSVRIREIASKSVEGSGGFMSEMVTPVPGAFLEKAPVLVKRVGANGELKMYDWGAWAHKVAPGEKTYSSWYA